MRARIAAALMTGAALVATGLAGCGSGGLSNAALRTSATRICNRANAGGARLHPPTSAAATGPFIRTGVSILSAELAELKELDPGGAARRVYRQALTAIDEELRALRATAADLARGADPITTVKELEARLAVLEPRVDAAWSALQIPACLTQ